MSGEGKPHDNSKGRSNAAVMPAWLTSDAPFEQVQVTSNNEPSEPPVVKQEAPKFAGFKPKFVPKVPVKKETGSVTAPVQDVSAANSSRYVLNSIYFIASFLNCFPFAITTAVQQLLKLNPQGKSMHQAVKMEIITKASSTLKIRITAIITTKKAENGSCLWVLRSLRALSLQLLQLIISILVGEEVALHKELRYRQGRQLGLVGQTNRLLR
jgi:hypothetical protein